MIDCQRLGQTPPERSLCLRPSRYPESRSTKIPATVYSSIPNLRHPPLNFDQIPFHWLQLLGTSLRRFHQLNTQNRSSRMANRIVDRFLNIDVLKKYILTIQGKKRIKKSDNNNSLKTAAIIRYLKYFGLTIRFRRPLF